ncbi:DUF1223 domain-containing protein [Yunchengibacter salinarum]|uniref:DUF1223 domain-containing protein n=1 Tax=Yunchengibacter salinarum TaxID=3133399 RepID=UPI0035B5E47A
MVTWIFPNWLKTGPVYRAAPTRRAGLFHARTALAGLMALLGTMAVTGAASAAEDTPRLTVVELFTSQGCSSCPPADAALRAMRSKPGVLTLSWPVDYWDRMGWKDTFASPDHTQRQVAYNKRLGRGGVYTPQMVFDGRVQCVGSKKDEIRQAISRARAVERPAITPTLHRDGEQVQVRLPATELASPVSVRVVWYIRNASVDIVSGENQGRTLHYTNVVRHSETLRDWDGSATTLTLDPAHAQVGDANAVALLLQDGYGHGPILGAANLELNTQLTHR